MTLIDPRGLAAEAPTPPAPRFGDLIGKRVLLLDNNKLSVSDSAYGVIAETLCDGLAQAIWSRTMENLLAINDTEVPAVAERLVAEHRPDACVLALADAGVTANTVLTAVALERRGIATCVIATPLGAGLARDVLASRVPGLDVVVLDVERNHGAARVTELTQQALPAVRALLQQPQAATSTAASTLYPPQADTWAAAAADMASFQDWADSAGLGDGLPLIPPTEGAIAAQLAAVPDDPDAVLYGPALTSGRVLRVRDAAANAVMAGSPPRGFPVVVTALKAMAKPGYRLSQAAITTHPGGNAVVLAGAEPERYGMTAGPGCLGPGHRGNATIGRAVSLSVLHLFGARPGGSDLTMFGSPAEFTYCLAEAPGAWGSLADDFGGKPGVLVIKAESPRNLLETLLLTPEALCAALADAAVSLCSNNSYIPGDLLVLLNPHHASLFAAAGMTRRDLMTAIHQRARIERRRVAGRGVGPIRPRYMDALDWLPVTRSADDVHIVVAGAAGPQSMVALPWGFSQGQWQDL